MQDGLKTKMLGMKMKLFRRNYHDSDNTNVQNYSRTYGFYKRLLTACIREDFKCKAQLQSPGQMFMTVITQSRKQQKVLLALGVSQDLC